jgi:hypothetical protein
MELSIPTLNLEIHYLRRLQNYQLCDGRLCNQQYKCFNFFEKANSLVSVSGVDKGGVQGVRTPPRAHPYTFTTE